MARNISALFPVIALFCLSSCFTKKNNESAVSNREAMMKADVDFSNLSASKGMKHAFLEYIDSNGVLLRPDTLPVIGADAVDYLIAQNDTGFSMSWAPQGGTVAASGELGYTFGVYELHPSTKDTVLYGTYVSVWKKQADGKWKFILDSGNEGIGKGE